MNTMKKAIALILSLTCCVSVAGLCGDYKYNTATVHAEEHEEKIFGDWSYVVYDKITGVCDTPCIEITKYNSDEKYGVTIPEKIDGMPVVSVAGDTFKEKSVSTLNISSSVKIFGENFVSNTGLYNIIFDNKLEFQPSMIKNPENSEETIIEGLKLTYVYPPSNKKIKEDIEIPETVCGLPVTAIENPAFQDNINIRSVKIPDTVKYFGVRVFADSSVQSVNIPKALKVLPSYTFKGCTQLKSVDFNENVIVAKKAFQDTDFSIPDNICISDTIANDSYVPVTVKSEPFTIQISRDNSTNEYACEIISYDPEYISGKTADIVIPDYFCEIPITKLHLHFWDTFNTYNIDINSIVFPSQMTEIRNISVNNPETIKSVTIKADNATIKQGAFKDTSIEEITLKGSCIIEAMSFMNCKNLRKVEFTGDSPEINIKYEAFKDCTALSEIIFPENMTADFKTDSFQNINIKELTLSGNINLDSHAFRDCGSLETLTLKGNVTLNENAFYNDNILKNIIIDTDKSINGSAFNGCVNLMNINSVPVFDTSTGSFRKEINEFIFNNFNNADDVGFINLYVQKQADDVVKKYTDDSMNDMQKIKALHDWVCNNIVYDSGNISDPKNHNDASVFMNDSSVCDGYAKCYNLLLNSAGIETYYLLGDNHAWNVVKLGNHYFHSDTTWDDGDTVSHDWFLKSDSEMLAETSSHSVWNFRTPSSLHNFQKESLPECRYSMGDLNTDGETNTADLVLLNKYLTGQSSVSADDIILADLTYDGFIDVFDLVIMRQSVLNK